MSKHFLKQSVVFSVSHRRHTHIDFDDYDTTLGEWTSLSNTVNLGGISSAWHNHAFLNAMLVNNTEIDGGLQFENETLDCFTNTGMFSRQAVMYSIVKSIKHSLYISLQCEAVQYKV